MGAFFLYKKDADINLESIKSCFSNKGFKNPNTYDFGLYTLLLYKKILVNTDNFLVNENGSIYSVGTVIYKRQHSRSGLEKILIDFTKKSLDFDQLIGSFFLLIQVEDKYFILTDSSNIQNVYYHTNKNVISSSFLAVIKSSKISLNLNKLAITEILTTGNLIGPDTSIKEIKRYDIKDRVNFDGIKILNRSATSIPEFRSKGYDECLNNQIEILENYFKSIKNFADTYGISSGLTSGLDSRLLLILVTKYLNNYQFFSTWRKIESIDFLIAQKVAKATGQNLIVRPVKDPLDMNKEQALGTLYQSFIFFDGLVRTHHLWTEEINTRTYRENLLNDKRISLSGVGGEQYRNQERVIRKKRNFMKWLEYELVFRHCGPCFTHRKDKHHFLDYFGTKIKNRLGIQDLKFIDHLQIKRYYNEIYNPANRTIRMNIENQIAYFLCPFTEYTLSHNAYKSIPHLGHHLKFEADMIKKLSPSIAAVETHYGPNLLIGDSIEMILKSYMKDFLPYRVFYKLYIKGKSQSRFYHNYEKKFAFVQDNTQLILDLDLPVNIGRLKKNSYLNPLIISMGYFLRNIDYV